MTQEEYNDIVLPIDSEDLKSLMNEKDKKDFSILMEERKAITEKMNTYIGKYCHKMYCEE